MRLFQQGSYVMNKKILLAVATCATLLLAVCPSTHTPLTDATVGASWMNIGVSNNNNTLRVLKKLSAYGEET